MSRAVKILFGLTAVVAFAYIGLLTYPFVTRQLPHQAVFLGSYGVVVGMLTIAGLTLAKFFWDMARSHERGYPPGSMLAACMLAIVGLLAVMKWSGEFDERVLGPHARFLDFGFSLGVLLGVCMIAALWLEERRKP
jgi:hypothetical protein